MPDPDTASTTAGQRDESAKAAEERDGVATSGGGGTGRARAAAGSAILVITSRTIATFISLAAVYFYTRHLEKTDLALSLIAGMLGELCYVLGDCGLGLCMERRLPGIIHTSREDGVALISVCMYVLMSTLIISCTGIYLLSGWLARVLLDDPAYQALLIVAIPYVAAVVWRNFMFSLMRGVNAYGRLSVLSLSSQFLYASLTIGGWLWLGGMRGFLLGAFLAYALPSLYESWVLRSYLSRPPNASRFRQYMGLSAPYWAERYVNYGFAYADQWVIGFLLNPAALATYYVPRNFFDRLQGLVEAFWMVATTTLSRESARGLEVARTAVTILRRFFVYVFIPMGVGLLASSYFLVDIFAGPRYRDAVYPFCILALYFTITGAFAASPVGLTVIAPPKERLKMIVVQNCVYLVALPLLAWTLELQGVAGARVLGAAAGTFAAWHLLEKTLQLRVRPGALKSVVLPSIVMFIVVAGGQYLHYSRATAPIHMLLGAVTYCVIFVLTVAVEDLRMLEQLLPSRLGFLARIGLRLRQRIAPTTA